MINKQSVFRPGRGGDPRMNRAVAARLQNPNMALIDALIAGGFKWESKNITDFCSDSDGISLSQRKNQLNRRLRYLKRKTAAAIKMNESGSDNQNHSLQPRSETYSFSSNGNTATVNNAAQVPCILQSSENLQYPSLTSEAIQHNIQKNRTKHFHTSCQYDANTIDNSSVKQCSMTSSCLNDDSPRTAHGGYGNDITETSMLPSSVASFALKGSNYADGKNETSLDSCTTFGAERPTVSEDEKMKMALDRFHIKNSILMKKCLLMAGIPAEENIESSTTFQDFAERATNFLAQQAQDGSFSCDFMKE